jgi:ribonuclease E
MEKSNKMLIDATHPEETRVVVLRNGRVEEFDYESAARKLLRGNIYLAKVTRVEPSLQAAFVDYGGNRHGFLAFSEIHPDYYQIPVADRQALLQEEAKPKRRPRPKPMHARRPRRPAATQKLGASPTTPRGAGRPHHEPPDQAPAMPPPRPRIATRSFRSRSLPVQPRRGRRHAEPAYRPPSGHERPPPTAMPRRAGGRGNGHVEEIVSDQAEAPETVSTVEQVGSEDALEEVPSARAGACAPTRSRR